MHRPSVFIEHFAYGVIYLVHRQNSTPDTHTQVIFSENFAYALNKLNNVFTNSRPYPLKFFKRYLPQIVLGPFVNTLSKMISIQQFNPVSVLLTSFRSALLVSKVTVQQPCRNVL